MTYDKTFNNTPKPRRYWLSVVSHLSEYYTQAVQFDKI